jgi:predicted acylesterase/phospholipase RssA
MDMMRLARKKKGPEPISWEAAFQHELAALGAAARPGRLYALCLSGGGVRSAAYCLGVLQALARDSRLTGFHYLSTVSGGGYVGAWLQTMIRRQGAEGAQERLARRDPAAPGQDPPELQRLRRYTNWLTPNGGLLSLDGWTGLAIYLRNVLLNWLVFGPLFLLGALLAVGARTVFFVLQGQPAEWQERLLRPIDLRPAMVIASLFLLAGLVGLAWGTVESCKGLPSRRPRRAGGPDYWQPTAIERRIVWPSLVWAFCIPPALAPIWGWVLQGPWWAQAALPLLFAGGSIAGYLAAAVMRPDETPSYWNNLVPWCLANTAGALMLYAGLLIAWALPENRASEIMAIAGPAWLLLCYAVLSAVHAGLRGATGTPWSRHAVDAFSDLDVEWMARITAMRLRVGLAWGGFAFCVLWLPHLVYFKPPYRVLPPVWVGALLAGPVAAWLGKQAFSQVNALLSGKPGLITWDLVLRAASLTFAAALLAGSGVTVQNLLEPLQDWFGAAGGCDPIGCMAPSYALSGMAMAVVLFGADNWIRTNRFSMHGVYRDRLVRAFVGPARAEPSDPEPFDPKPSDPQSGGAPRHADPFTGFDPRDNPRLSALVPNGETRCLFPVINVTLNLSASRRADWADRKAAPFTLTPLHCGAAHLARRSGQYVATGQYAGSGAGGISLGTAMAVSGAAVSPNWGYHSSGLTAFIMTLFNVRLGAWLPNPARPRGAFDQPDAPGWWMLLDELLARTDDDRDYVYLSDGGHFDNLGVYEMLRRRCRLIAVVDATRDPDGGCADLGAVIGKARIDMGVQIRMARARPKPKASSQGVNGLSIGLIRYPDGARGVLLVLKPALTGGMPADVRAYSLQDRSFPNEATTEQWFTEAQFESHRALGAHQAGLALGRLRQRLARRSLLTLSREC